MRRLIPIIIAGALVAVVTYAQSVAPSGGGGVGVGDANTWTAEQTFNVTDGTDAITLDQGDYLDLGDNDVGRMWWDGTNAQFASGRFALNANYIQFAREAYMNSGGRFGSSGTVISDSYAASSALDFGSVPADECADLSITVTGAAANDVCAVGAPASPQAHFSFTCYVSASDTVQVRACNHTAGAVDPASATYSVRVWDP